MTTPGPATDDEIPGYLDALGIPALADIHVHFLPESMMRKVWTFFDRSEEHYGMPWPIQYRFDEATRIHLLRGFRLAAIPALSYPHKPGMAEWLNDWSAEFARRTPGALQCGTLFPEPGVGDYVRRALADGAVLFKVHIEVGVFAPDDPLLADAWAALEDAGVPIVVHAGSAPRSGPFTGPAHIRALLDRHPRLTLVIAHLGMPDYDTFADIALQHERVHLDTTMIGTDFTEAFAPMPASYRARLPELKDRIILGSDFPNIPYPYAEQLTALSRLDLGDDWMRQVLWTNGARLLGLSQPA